MSSGKAKSNKNNGKAKDDLDVNEWEEMRELERKAIRKEQEEKRKNKMKSGKTEDMDASPPWKSKTFIKTPKLVRQDSDEDEIWENEVDGGRIVRDWVRSKDDSDRYYVSFRANESVGGSV